MTERIFQGNSEARPWTRWWWFGCAVECGTVTQLLETYSKAGLGGVEITFIYGVRGFESKNIEYLSREWRDAVQYTVSEAQRLGMQVDITLGGGWRTGGSFITDDVAAARYSVEKTPSGSVIKCNPTGELVKRSGPGGKGRPLIRSAARQSTQCSNIFSRTLKRLASAPSFTIHGNTSQISARKYLIGSKQ